MIFDAIKPYLYGVAALAWVISCVGIWFYRGNIDAQVCNATLEQEQNNEYATMLAYERSNAAASATAAAKAKTDEYQFQTQLAEANRHAAAADAASGLLQQSLAGLSAGSEWANTPGESLTCVPVSEANNVVGRLADGARTLDADGLRASKQVAECAVRLSACEKWSDTVESEFGVTK